ncbi:MAG: hypothetical protein ACOCWT_01455 [Desulfohalobiaceae bacterium]
MQSLFMDLLTLEGMQGVFLLSSEGEVLYRHASSQEARALQGYDWAGLAGALQSVVDMDVIFDRLRVYLKRQDSHVLVLIMGLSAPVALSRMNSDVALAKLKKQDVPTKKKGLSRFFKG